MVWELTLFSFSLASSQALKKVRKWARGSELLQSKWKSKPSEILTHIRAFRLNFSLLVTAYNFLILRMKINTQRSRSPRLWGRSDKAPLPFTIERDLKRAFKDVKIEATKISY